MDERSAYAGRDEAAEKVHSQPETRDLEGMGSNGERGCRSRKARDSSYDALSVEEASGPGGCRVSQRESPQGRSSDTSARTGESEAEGHCDASFSGADELEKKDELGLIGREFGERYSQEQKEGIVQAVQRLKNEGVPIADALRQLGVPRSTYYYWKGRNEKRSHRTPPNSLLPCEEEQIVALKMRQPHLSHRQISGLLRRDNVWVSPSSCYRTLKGTGLIWEWSLRQAPWKKARYEPFRPNQIWAEDWTGIVIRGVRHYVLTILDTFSRYIVAWGIVKTVTQTEVKNLVALAAMSEKIDGLDAKPTLRTDPGSPNMAADVRLFLKEIGVTFSPGRSARPTDNARQERFYRTLKQEEVYCNPDYLSIEAAREAIGQYIDYYNEVRPHQALFGYTPGHVHRVGNKSLLLDEYRLEVQKAKELRLRERREKKINS